MDVQKSQSNKDQPNQPNHQPMQIQEQDPYNLQPNVHPITAQLRENLEKQAQQFHLATEQHLQNKFFSQPYYFLISTKWLARWKVYVSYQQITTAQPHHKLFGCGKLPSINSDIVEDKVNFKLKFYNENDYLNVVLKAGLQENSDYQFCSEKMWNVIKYREGVQVKRMVVQSNCGEKVQLYYRKLTILPIFNHLLKNIQHDTITKMVEVDCQVSHYQTILDLQLFLRNMVLSSMSASLSYMTSFQKNTPMKIWLLPQDTRKNILLNTLLAGCKANRSYSYNIFIDAEYMEPSCNLLEFDLSQKTMILTEIKQRSQGWCLFNMKQFLHNQCDYCRRKEDLQFICSCKYAVYCSRECKVRDKSHHRMRCPNQAESDEQKQQLKLKPQSRLGITGLRNIGNTCFMNSGLQCLSSIPQLTQFFITDKYLKDINKNNPLGTQGELSLAYGKLLKHLWYGTESSFTPNHFKRAIAKFQPMFTGYNQHDSGQLVNYLLDGLHEDLNRVLQKPYVQTKDYDGRPDNIIARQSWHQFLMRNQSIIVDLMYGQYRSVVDCPKCQTQSIQFDPFLVCSIPITNSSMKEIKMTVVRDHLYMHKLDIIYDKKLNWKMSDVIQDVKNKLKIDPNSKVISYVTSYSSCELIDPLRSADDVRKQYKFRSISMRELLPEQDPNLDIKVMITNVICHSYYGDQSFRKNISSYRVYFFNPQITCKELHHRLYEFFKQFYPVSNYQQEVIQPTIKQQPFRFLLIPSSRYYSCKYCSGKSCDGCPLPYNDKTLSQVIKADTKVQIQLYWRTNDKKIEKQFDDIKTKTDIENTSKNAKSGTNLFQCLKLFSQPEILEQENAWYCPKCKQFVLAKKQMQIYKAPQIFIICLKRFKRKQYYQQKFNIMVDFPIHDLDLSEFVINSNLPADYAHSQQTQNQDGHEKVFYELFGITNHFGSTGGGHYTAYCKNKNNNQWYDFDDSCVNPLKLQTDLVSESAYILFYRRKT